LTYFCQASYPAVATKIKSQLSELRKNSIGLSLISVCGVMVATIIREQPVIMEHTFKDGSTFHASDSFVRKWLHGTMGWSLCKGTRAAHKLLDDWEGQCEKLAIRKAYLLKEFDIPDELFANSDQTNRKYAPGDKPTYAKTGAKQVSVIGAEEKRAFTVMVTITSAGCLLPFQVIYQGKTERSCPNSKSPHYDAAIAAGFQFEFSDTKTY
jgi:hypothetical protein